MGLPAFYVMKYEAKAMLNDESASSATGTDATPATHKPVSTADNQPWRNIDANDSAAECESLGSGYHLISNPEWMAIAREIENQGSNWTGGSVGSGCMFRGNSGDTTCGYNSSTDPDSGSSRNVRAKHTLSNGQEVFDISGNVYEWTDWDKDTLGFQLAPTTCATGWTELPVVSCLALSGADYNTDNATYTSTEGAGRLYGGSGGAALRGGFWIDSTYAGAFVLGLFNGPSETATGIGFRCVFRP